MTEWTNHTPGDARPVSRSTWVKVKFRDGSVGDATAEELDWGEIEDDAGAEIVAYRVVEEPEFEPELAPTPEPTMHGVPLRDWFAGQALAAMPKLGDTDADVRGIAHDAYLLADAMMAERAKGAGQ